MAVGGDYEAIGVYEHALLRAHGLQPDSVVMDIGCGSGRLAFQLRRYPALGYVGTDPVPALLDYARRKVERPDFRFVVEQENQLPVPNGSADFVVFFRSSPICWRRNPTPTSKSRGGRCGRAARSFSRSSNSPCR
jgi:SAM-dependent methyltransferase